MSYTVIITEEVAANIAVTTQNYPITIEYNATNLSDGGSYGNANVAAYLASGSDTANITTTANISGAYILGNGSQLTGITAVSTDRKSTRLNSSHRCISYAVFCLKKKKK